MNVFDLSAKITMDINGYLKGMDTAKAIAISTMSAIGGEVSKFMTDSVNVGMEFDKSISQVAATMGKTVTEMGDTVETVDTQFGTFTGNLREYAQYMGRNTAFSATQAADALNYMALAGYDTQKSMQMLPNVLNLAAAGQMDLARASDMVTDTQTAFGIGTLRTTQMVDEMAKAASTGNTSVEQLGDAFLVVGGLAKELNGGMVTLSDGTKKSTDGVQEMEIALTAMANAGVKGSEAGTHMRNMIMKLSSPTKEGAEQMEKLGVSIFDTDGKMRSLSEIFGDLNVSMSKLTQEEKIQAISDLFNARDLSSAEALLAAISQDWNAIGESILEAKGSAAEMAETQLDNLAGDITLFESALEGAQIALSDSVTPALREFTQFGTEAVQALTEAFLGLPEPIQTTIGMIGLVGGKIAEVTPSIISMGGSLAQMAQQSPKLASALSKLGGVLTSLPFLGVAAGIAAAVAALASLKSNIEANTKVVREFKEEAGEISSVVDSAVESVRAMSGAEITAEDAATKLAQAQSNLDDLTRGAAQASEQEAEATSALNNIMVDGTSKLNDMEVELDGLGTFMNIASAGTFELATKTGVLAEEVIGYSESAKEMSAAQIAANTEIENATKQVSLWTAMASAQDELEKQVTETVLASLDPMSMSTEQYQFACEAIQRKNEKHQEEQTVLRETYAVLSEQAEQARETYDEFMKNARDNIDSVIGFHNNMKEVVVASVDAETGALMVGDQKLDESKQIAAISIDEMIGSFKSQADYMFEYADNLKEAMRLGVDEGIIEQLSDGSVESARILAGIVADGGEHVNELNAEFGRVEEGKEQFVSAVDSANYEFGRIARMTELRATIAAQNLNKSDEAYASSVATVQGAVRGVDDKAGLLIDRYARLGAAATSAYNSALQIASPSKVFRKSGQFTVMGAILGVNDKERDLMAAYDRLASVGLAAYMNRLRKTRTTVPKQVLPVDEWANVYTTDAKGNITEKSSNFVINMNVNGSNGQDVTQLANIVINKLKTQINREVAVYA